MLPTSLPGESLPLGGESSDTQEGLDSASESVRSFDFGYVVRRDGDVAQLVEHWTGTLLMQIRFPCAARDFSLRVNFQCRLSYSVRTPPCAIA